MVNIKDYPEVEVPEGDKLELLFARQRELMEKYEPIERANGLLQTSDVPVKLDSYQGQARLKDFAWRITEELGEAMNCLKMKPWKQTPQVTDREHYLEELVDAAHFFFELLILSGFTPAELVFRYLQKWNVNKFRQRSQY